MPIGLDGLDILSSTLGGWMLDKTSGGSMAKMSLVIESMDEIMEAGSYMESSLDSTKGS